MAYTISEVNAVSHELFDTKCVQSVYQDSPFYALLQKRNKIKSDGGTSIQFPVRLDQLGQSKLTGPRAQVVFESKETRTAGTLDWAYYDGVTLMHWDEQVANRGKGQIVDLLKDKAKELAEDMGELMANVLYGTSIAGMIPLATIVDAADTYAGITVSDAPVWASYEDSSSTVLTLPLIRHARNEATFGKNKPTHIFTTRDLFSKLEALIEPKERIANKELASVGFDSIELYGIPVVADPFCLTGDMFGLDLDKYELRVNQNLETTEWFDLKQAGFPHALGKYISTVLNLKCEMRRTSFKFTALDYTL